MKKDVIARLKENLESIRKEDVDSNIEFWCARDLMGELGYRKWQNFKRVVEKAKSACSNAGYKVTDHFADISKKAHFGVGAEREIEDVALTRYACYLVAQNGDPAKPRIAFAQTYFAMQTRKLELLEERMAELESKRYGQNSGQRREEKFSHIGIIETSRITAPAAITAS